MVCQVCKAHQFGTAEDQGGANRAYSQQLGWLPLAKVASPPPPPFHVLLASPFTHLQLQFKGRNSNSGCGLRDWIRGRVLCAELRRIALKYAGCAAPRCIAPNCAECAELRRITPDVLHRAALRRIALNAPTCAELRRCTALHCAELR